MFSFLIGCVVGIAIGILAAIFLPARWKKITDEAQEEINKRR